MKMHGILRSAIPDRQTVDGSATHDILHYKMNDDASISPGADDGRKTQLLKGLAELALLSLLRDAPLYGLEILDRLRADAGLQLAEGAIYPLLHRLEKAGLTRAEWRIETDGGRPRKYYALTAQGRGELAAQLQDWRVISSRLNAFLERTPQ
jgi:PadR family transcriptional regulator PadR